MTQLRLPLSPSDISFNQLDRWSQSIVREIEDSLQEVKASGALVTDGLYD